MKKRIVSITAAALMLSVSAMPASAVSMVTEEVNTASYSQLQYKTVDYASSSLSMSRGSAMCCSKLTGSGKTTKISATQYLERWTGGRYSIYKAWISTANGSTLTMNNGNMGIKDGQYRLRTVFKVYAGSKYETITKYSAVRSIQGGIVIRADETEEDTRPTEGECGAMGDNIKWKLSDDGVLTLTGSGTTILNHTPEESMFYNDERIKSIVIGEGILSAGLYLFNGCTSLESVSLPSTVTDIGAYTFLGCTSLKKITISEKNEKYYVRDGMVLSKDKFGKGVKICLCPRLDQKEYTVPDYITGLASYAFSNSGIEKIYVPKTVENLYVSPFSECSTLKEIVIDPEHEKYSSVDGVLFNKSLTSLVTYPANREAEEYTVPESVTNFEMGAFDSCKNLKHVTLPETSAKLLDTSAGMFCNCASLKSVDFPSNISYISPSIFDGCTSLEKINISENNNNYSSVDGVLYSKDKTKLVYCPIAGGRTEYTVPASVKTIGLSAFRGYTTLMSITIENPQCDIQGQRKFYDTYDGNQLETVATIFDMSFLGKMMDHFDGTIYGKAGSTAEAYAKEYGYKFDTIENKPEGELFGSLSAPGNIIEILAKEPSDVDGDINHDDLVNVSDVIAFKKALSTKTATGEMDINGDGAVNVFDLVALERIISESN